MVLMDGGFRVLLELVQLPEAFEFFWNWFNFQPIQNIPGLQLVSVQNGSAVLTHIVGFVWGFRIRHVHVYPEYLPHTRR